MKVQAVYMFLLFICSHVTSDWVEIPQTSMSKTSNLQNVSTLEKFTTFSTPIITLLTPAEVVASATLSSTLNEQHQKKKVVLIGPIIKHPYLNVTDLKIGNIRNGTLIESTTKENISYEKSRVENVETSHDSNIINETLEAAESDVFNQPNTSLSQKLTYLHKMEGEMSAQIKKLSQGLWTDRQARGKKLLGFASMEGALMTIAFLTFAVFLVKVVHQFIQGLQTSELAMVALPTAPAIRLSRPKRQQTDLAAAQLLHYMDEFRIKHRISCDSS